MVFRSGGLRQPPNLGRRAGRFPPGEKSASWLNGFNQGSSLVGKNTDEVTKLSSNFIRTVVALNSALDDLPAVSYRGTWRGDLRAGNRQVTSPSDRGLSVIQLVRST